jgi:hypothetical protein
MSKALEYPISTDRWQVRQVFENDKQEGNTEEDKNGLIVFIKTSTDQPLDSL